MAGLICGVLAELFGVIGGCWLAELLGVIVGGGVVAVDGTLDSTLDGTLSRKLPRVFRV